MCCKRRNRHSQARALQARVQSSGPSPDNILPTRETISSTEVEKAAERPNIAPPRYSQIVVNRLEIPPSPALGELKEYKEKGFEEPQVRRDSLQSSRSIDILPNGRDESERGLSSGNQPTTLPTNAYMSVWEQYKAVRAARKAERKAHGRCCL